MYRDAGNYKQYGSVVFARQTDMEIAEVEKAIRSRLIDEMYFVAGEWGVPALHAYAYDEDLDHGWHEFVGVEETEDAAGDGRTMEGFLKRVI